MIALLIIMGCITAYVVGAAFTLGLARHCLCTSDSTDEGMIRALATIFWPVGLPAMLIGSPVAGWSEAWVVNQAKRRLKKNEIRLKEAKRVRVAIEENRRELEEIEEQLTEELKEERVMTR